VTVQSSSSIVLTRVTVFLGDTVMGLETKACAAKLPVKLNGKAQLMAAL
jgi:hypothetical protein